MTQFNRDTAAPQPSTALTATCAADLPKTVAADFPWLAATGATALNPLTPCSDTQRRERPGPSGALVPAGIRPRAARRRAIPSSSAIASPLATPQSRAAVTSAQSRGALASPKGLTASAAHHEPRSAGDAPRPADVPAAVGAPRNRDADRADAKAGAPTTSTAPIQATAGAPMANQSHNAHPTNSVWSETSDLAAEARRPQRRGRTAATSPTQRS